MGCNSSQPKVQAPVSSKETPQGLLQEPDAGKPSDKVEAQGSGVAQVEEVKPPASGEAQEEVRPGSAAEEQQSSPKQELSQERDPVLEEKPAVDDEAAAGEAGSPEHTAKQEQADTPAAGTPAENTPVAEQTTERSKSPQACAPQPEVEIQDDAVPQCGCF
jgi:hypothetical protein